MSDLFDFRFRIDSATDGTLFDAVISQEVYSQQHAADFESKTEMLQLSTTVPVATESRFPSFILNNPPSIGTWTLMLQFEEVSTLVFPNNSYGIHTGFSVNPRWPNLVRTGSNPEQGYLIVEKNEKSFFLPSITNGHPLSFAFKIDWHLDLAGKIRVKSFRRKDLQTGHRSPCQVKTGCTRNTPSFSTPRWKLDSAVTAAGTYDFTNNGRDLFTGSGQTASDANLNRTENSLTPDLVYSRGDCETIAEASGSVEWAEEIDSGEPLVGFAPQSDLSDVQIGGSRTFLPWMVTNASIRVDLSPTPGKRKAIGYADLLYFPSDTTSKTQNQTDSGWGLATAIETDRRKYFDQGDITKYPAPASVTVGNQYRITSYGHPSINGQYSQSFVIERLQLFFEKEVNEWSGEPPVIEFTEADLVQYQAGTEPSPTTKADLTQLTGRDHYVTQVNNTAPVIQAPHTEVQVGSSGSTTAEITVLASLIDFDDFSFRWVPETDAFPHPGQTL
ncbi:hypothetical protein LOC72_06400 [Roseiconus lacunae]|nr:hypothetical protein [Roseiconus lacunae]